MIVADEPVAAGSGEEAPRQPRSAYGTPPAPDIERPELRSGPSPDPPVLPSLRHLISLSLRWGVAVSAALLVAGVILLLAQGTSSGWGPTPAHLNALGTGLVSGSPVAFLLLGFLVLILTPFLRVVISVASFAVARDRAFAAITLFVLVVLGVSILVGLGG